MTMHDIIRRELRIVFEYGVASATSGILPSREQVIESSAIEIERAVMRDRNALVAQLAQYSCELVAEILNDMRLEAASDPV